MTCKKTIFNTFIQSPTIKTHFKNHLDYFGTIQWQWNYCKSSFIVSFLEAHLPPKAKPFKSFNPNWFRILEPNLPAN